MTKVLLKAVAITTITTSVLGFSSFASFAYSKASNRARESTQSSKAAIRATISETAPTRINFGNLQINEVIGDENKYKIITDSNGLNLFITPKLASGSIIPMTLIAGGNRAQDLLLEVSSEEKLPRSIVISSGSNKGDVDESLSSNKSEAELLLHAMLEDYNPHDKYYVTQTKRKLTIPHLSKLSITQDKAWRYKNLTGVSLTITNKDKVAANVQSKGLRSLFKNTKCTVIDSNLLTKGGSAKAFIITEEEEVE